MQLSILPDTNWRKAAPEVQLFAKNFKLFLDDLCDCVRDSWHVQLQNSVNTTFPPFSCNRR